MGKKLTKIGDGIITTFEFTLEHFWVLFFYLIVGYFLFVFLTLTPLPANDSITTSETFSGSLGMVSYENSWFGLGGPDKTLCLFQNESDLVEFKFNQYLNVDIGKNYTVYYNITKTFYYNVTGEEIYSPLFPPFAPWHRNFTNSTEIEPLNIISVASK